MGMGMGMREDMTGRVREADEGREDDWRSLTGTRGLIGNEKDDD